MREPLYDEDRVYTEGQGWATEQRGVPFGQFRAIFDLPNLQHGWFNFTRGASDVQLYALGEDIGDRPGKDYREGIRVLVSRDGVVRELSSTAVSVRNSFDTLHDDYEADLDPEHPDYLPVVQVAGVTEEKTPNGTSAAPIWKIVEWVPRPPELPAGGIAPAKYAAKDKAANGDGTIAEFKRAPVRNEMDDEIPF
jgi:hypothetical protein